ncbi:MAG: hypothetical protein RJB38_1334 [Pseudomonadota bacterium]|jgi:NAD(P)-dependent dehydrogenase (short-subunit alcohol dehydrogenase family)
MTPTNRVALITGANKGIGLAVCRKLAESGVQVILGARDAKKGATAAEALRSQGLPVVFQKLDVTSADDIKAVHEFIVSKFGRLDILVNNAGVLLDPPRHPPDAEGASVFNAKLDTIRGSLETNTFGALRLCQRFVPLMLKNGYGRVVNLSSGMGQLSDMNGGWPGYRISKVALNAVTRIFADETAGSNVLINSVCPGWVKTDMGGQEAERAPEGAAEGIVWLATLPDGGPTGGFFRDKEPIEW